MSSTSACEKTASETEPFQFLITSALNHVRTLDPTWETIQPIGFRAVVVDRWKTRIRTEIWIRQALWSLTVADREFSILRPLFGFSDPSYNPYRDPLKTLVRFDI